MENALVTTQAKQVVTAEMTFDQVVAEWFKSDSFLHAKEQTKTSYRKSLKAFKKWLVSRAISQPTKQDVKDWCENMDSEGLSVATKNLRLTTVRNFFKWLNTEYGVPNIADNLRGWKETKEHRRGFLSCEEMKLLLDSIDTSTLRGKRDKAIVGVLLTGGLRTIEISRLHIKDIKHEGGVIYLAVLGKGKDETENVKISRKAEQLIRDWLSSREQAEVLNDNSPLFCSLSGNSFGKPITSNSVSTLCKKYLELAGLKSENIVAHSLRHSLATNALMKGASLQEVQSQLRHSNIAVTNIYLHEVNKAKNRCTDLISEEIF